LAVAAAKAAEPSAHTIAVSTAQGISKGMTGGTFRLPPPTIQSQDTLSSTKELGC
jgi:hypothetical protein